MFVCLFVCFFYKDLAGWKTALYAIQCKVHDLVAVVLAFVDLLYQQIKPTGITLGATRTRWIQRSKLILFNPGKLGWVVEKKDPEISKSIHSIKK